LDNIKDLLSGLTDEFCAEHLKEFMETLPLRRFLFGLSQVMGISSVVGDNILLSMLIRFEARQESMNNQKKMD